MGNYRDRLQIIADILSIASKRAKKTQIMYQANLSYRLLCRYLGEVLDADLVSFEKGDCYVLTAKGKEFLGRHEEYSKRCKSLEEHLNHVNSEKTVLEKMSFNASKVNNNLNHANSKKESKDKT
jgi:predicted transcriptional regulator